MPGTTLGGSVDVSFSVIADMAGRLARRRAPVPTARSRRSPSTPSADGWRGALAHRPDDLAELDALLALPAAALIHNDLYQDNLLRAGDGWVVIDPKPVLADPHAECFAFLAAAEHVTDRSLVDRYARIADLPDPAHFSRGGSASAR